MLTLVNSWGITDNGQIQAGQGASRFMCSVISREVEASVWERQCIIGKLVCVCSGVI